MEDELARACLATVMLLSRFILFVLPLVISR
jgi:hypothetical protein